MTFEKKLLKTSKIVFMYSNSLARHFSPIFHTKCLLPRQDRLLPVRSCLKYFYQCTFILFWALNYCPDCSKTQRTIVYLNYSFSLYLCPNLTNLPPIDPGYYIEDCWILTVQRKNRQEIVFTDSGLDSPVITVNKLTIDSI